MATSSLKQLAVIGAALALLAGCASQQEKPADATKQDTSADRAAADKKAAEEAAARAAAEKKAAEEAAARAAAEKKAAEEAEAKRRAAAAAPPPPKDVALKSTGLFDFDKAVLRPDAKAALDKDVVARRGEISTLKSVIVDGHADRLGSHEYNQRLSEKRAEVAKAYLVGKGIPADSIVTNGYGKTTPATGPGVGRCEDSLGRKKLIECLQPHRRVVVDVKGAPK